MVNVNTTIVVVVVVAVVVVVVVVVNCCFTSRFGTNGHLSDIVIDKNSALL